MTRLKSAVILLGLVAAVLFFGVFGVIVQRPGLFQRACDSQPFAALQAGQIKKFFWRSHGWLLSGIETPLRNPPDVRLRVGHAELFPDYWNLAAGCPGAANLTVQNFSLRIPGDSDLAEFAKKTLLQARLFSRTSRHSFLCRRVRFEARDGSVRAGKPVVFRLPVSSLILSAGAEPRLEIEGPDQNFGVTATYRPEIDRCLLTLHAFKSGLVLDGVFTDFSQSNAFFRGSLNASGVSLSWSASEHGLQAGGTFSASAEFSGPFNGLSLPLEVPAVWALEGALEGRMGHFGPFNAVSEVFRQASQIPGLEELKQPQNAVKRPWLAESATPYEAFRAVIGVRAQVLYFGDVVLKHEDFLAEGEGAWDLRTGQIRFAGRLVLSETWSRELTAQSAGLRQMQGNQTRLVFPFQIEGGIDHPRVRADLADMAAKLIAVYRSRLVEEGNKRRAET